MKAKGLDYISISGKDRFFARKIVTLSACFLLIVYALTTFLIALGSGKSYEVLGAYFRNYKSSRGYNELELGVELPEGTSVSSYDNVNKVFITTAFGAGDFTYFGLCGTDEEYVAPLLYTNIISIEGDYALVTKLFEKEGKEGEYVERIGVIKFRNTSDGETWDITDFSLNFDDTFTQLRFVTDKYGERYLAALNEINNTDATKGIMTFYDYTTVPQALEVFKANIGAEVQSIVLADGNLVAIYKDYAVFYKTAIISGNGFLISREVYKPFPEDDTGSFAEYTTTMVSYLGGGWFMRWAYLADEEGDESYEGLLNVIKGSLIKTEKYDSVTGEVKTIYMFQRSDRFNANNLEKVDNGKLIPDAVVNKYTSDASRGVSAYMNNDLQVGLNESLIYTPPSFPVSEMVQSGMSVVYYYYFPYKNEPFRPAFSFVVFDSNGKMFQPKENILFPVLLVDGKGVQVDAPHYNIPLGDVQIIAADNTVSTFKTYNPKLYGYVNTTYHDGMLITAEYKVEKESEIDEDSVLYGAYNLEGKLVTGYCKYSEMTLYMGGYSTASAVIQGTRRYYRVDKEGNETRLDNVHSLRNGVYVTKASDKFSLYTNSGKLLLNAVSFVGVYEDFLAEGEFLSSVVVAIDEAGVTRIYKLK